MPPPQRQPKAQGRPDSNRHNRQATTNSSNRPRANSHSLEYSIQIYQIRPELSRRVTAQPGGPLMQMDPEPQQVLTTQEPKSMSRSIDISGPPQEIRAGPEDLIQTGVKRVDSNLSKHDAAKELERLRKENQALKAQLQQMSAEPDILDRLAISENNNEALRKQMRQFQERANHTAEQYKEENQRLQQDKERLLQEANKTIQSMATENSKKSAADEEKIRVLFDKVTRDKVEGRWNPLPDDELRHKLSQLNNDMRDWSKNWATKSLNLEKGVSKELSSFFKLFVRLDPNGGLPPLLKKPPTKLKDKLGQVLLHAALAYQVHYDFLAYPFFCTTSEQAAVLADLFQSMREADVKGANVWRAGFWRLLNPPPPADGSRPPKILENTRINVRNHCDTVTQQFIAGDAGIFMSPCAENSPEAQNRASRLRKILQDAATIATHIWTQHSILHSIDLAGIYRKNMTFDVADPFLTGHPLSKVDNDKPEKFNNRGIVLCARPALIASDVDDANGIDGDRYRVLAPAMVLLDGTF